MDEPTVPEMIRALQSDVQRMISAQELYVTREVLDLRLAALEKDQAEDRARMDNFTRVAWTSVLAPVIVGVILYFLLGSKS